MDLTNLVGGFAVGFFTEQATTIYLDNIAFNFKPQGTTYTFTKETPVFMSVITVEEIYYG